MNPTKRGVIYCRVSTKEQVEEGNSLVTQEKNCREYALKHGYEVASVFIEQGESAKTADRTELKKLLTFCALKKNNITAIIAYKIDRISRNIDDYSQIRIQLKRYGVEIKSTTEPFEDTPAGRFMENIIANVAQFDNDVRAERSIGGMRDAVREGRYVWCAPFGYVNVRYNGKATIAPTHDAKTIHTIFERIAKNTDPVGQVRKDLIAEGVLFIKDKPMSQSCFYSLIRNELYTGWMTKFGERHKGSFTPIISDELFAKVQKVLFRKDEPSKPYQIANPDFPLRRFFYHTSGKKMTGCWTKGKQKKYPYYMIHKTGINIRKELLEESFIDMLNKTFKMNIHFFEKLNCYLNEYLQNGHANVEKIQQSLEGKIIALKDKRRILIDKNVAGIISDELCKEALSKVQASIYECNNQLASVPKTINDKDSLLKFIRPIFLRPGDMWKNAHFSQKVLLQRFYFPEGIEISKDGSRTPKVSRFFNLKQCFMPDFSCLVNHPDRNLNTKYWQLPLTLPKDLYIESPESILHKIFSEEEGGELVQLASMLEKTDN